RFPAFVPKHRTARDDSQVRQLRQLVDDAFCKSIADPFGGLIFVLISKGNYRDRLNRDLGVLSMEIRAYAKHDGGSNDQYRHCADDGCRLMSLYFVGDELSTRGTRDA